MSALDAARRGGIVASMLKPAGRAVPKRVAAAAVMALIAGSALAQTCSPPTSQPYRGPLFDAMAQTDQRLDGEAAIAAARSAGVNGMALFARVHKHADGQALVDALAAAHPDFIVRGAPKLFDMRGDLDGGFVKDVVAGSAAGRYAFVGEILYTHGDKADGEATTTGERFIDPMKPQTARLISGLKGRRIPVMTHWEVYEWARDRPRFDALYTAFPDQTFVWPHVGFGTPDQVAAVLGAHPNVWATLSKKEAEQGNFADENNEDDVGGPVSDACGVLLPEWRDIMAGFSDRLMFATDAHKAGRWDKYRRIVRRWREILGQLPPGTASAIAYGNAARLYGLPP